MTKDKLAIFAPRVVFSALMLLLFSSCRAVNHEAPSTAELLAINRDSAELRYGVAPQWYETYSAGGSNPRSVDIVGVGSWLIQDGFQGNHESAIRQIIAANKTPYLFGYIASASVKQSLGARNDCDANSRAALCTSGAERLRSEFDGNILPKYIQAAQRINGAASGKEVLIHLEPDWMQYSENSQGNPLTKDESHGFRNKMIQAFKDHCSSCRIALDFSPWFNSGSVRWANSIEAYYAGLDKSVVKHIAITGKPYSFTEGGIDSNTYRQMTEKSGLSLIVVSAFDFGGGPTGLDRSWLSEDARVKAPSLGVAGVLLSLNDPDGYEKFLNSRQQVSKTPNRGSTVSLPEVVEEKPETKPQDQTQEKPEIKPNVKPESKPEVKPDIKPEARPGQNGDVGSSAITVGGGNYSIDARITSEWGAGYCKHIRIKNLGNLPSEWTMRVRVEGRMYTNWSSQVREDNGLWIFTGVDYNRRINPGQDTDVGYCATR